MKKRRKIIFIIILIVLATIAALVFSLLKKDASQEVQENIPEELVQETNEGEENALPGIGKTLTLNEENIEGSYPQIEGNNFVAKSAREYINNFIRENTNLANTDLPGLRVDFPEFADRKYAVNVNAHYFKSPYGDSIVLEQFLYTAGANGNSFFMSFNQNPQGEKITLKDVIPEEKRASFTNEVKTRLSHYEMEGESIELFPEEVEALTFDRFTRFAFDGETLMLYFDKYELAPGAVGPITLSIQNFKNI